MASDALAPDSSPDCFPVALLRQCWFVCGPTAAGKTAAGLALAGQLGAEVLALDSMTVYRGLEIGTAKPSVAERSRIPHHLLDLFDVAEDCSVVTYLERAAAAATDVLDRGRIPLFVGGTGLYLRSILRGLFAGPPADPEFRAQLETEAARHGSDWLHQQLAAVDPDAAARLHPADQRRIIRALEVQHHTGRTASSLQQQGPRPLADRTPHVYWLDLPRAVLYDRINQRVDAMLRDGWLEEVRRLLAAPGGLGPTASQALGYSELAAVVRGELTLPAARDIIQTRTRQFAKRQLTWFRNLEECRPVPLTGMETPDEVADLIRQQSRV